MSARKVKYKNYEGETREMALRVALQLIDSDEVHAAFERLMTVLTEKGVISLEEAAKIVKDDSILGWAEDDNGEG